MLENADWTSLLLGLVLGAVVSWLSSLHFHRRATQRSLALYVKHNVLVLAGVEEHIRSKLRLQYEDAEITQLQHVELYVANVGDTPIDHVTRPLTLKLPPDARARLLDVVIAAVEPPDRDARVMDFTEVSARFAFEFLSARECFVIRLLIDGNVAPSAIQASLSCPGLEGDLAILQLGQSKSVIGRVAKAIVGLAAFATFFSIVVGAIIGGGYLAQVTDSTLVGFVGAAVGGTLGIWVMSRVTMWIERPSFKMPRTESR